MGEVLLTKGGYGGGYDEELFKPFTTRYMEYWWFFREVLLASDRKSDRWKKKDGTILANDEQKELISISMQNYAVHTGIAEAIIYRDQMEATLHELISPMRWFEVRRLWKATYSSLYTSFNAICNIVYVLLTQDPVVYVNKDGILWNYTPGKTIGIVEKKGIKELIEPLKRCRQRLEIRDHLDHYWTIWLNVDYRLFLRDENFTKGYIVTDPKEVRATVDAYKQADEDIHGIAEDYNLIYRELSLENRILDNYLAKKEWMIDYSDFGEPHFGKRPSPKGNY